MVMQPHLFACFILCFCVALLCRCVLSWSSTALFLKKEHSLFSDDVSDLQNVFINYYFPDSLTYTIFLSLLDVSYVKITQALNSTK
jgi:hypothetical protein